jgi:D-aminoacyl-tRNA deacylase
MRVVIQRVMQASVKINSEITGSIDAGLLVFVGIEEADGHEDIAWLSKKITRLRVMGDANGVMNLSVIDVGGGILVVSQFTLHASIIKGNRPSYIRAARPENAEPLYLEFCKKLSDDLGKSVATGIFGAQMNITLINDGPVTIVIDSKSKE